jgi:hypothetical protein
MGYMPSDTLELTSSSDEVPVDAGALSGTEGVEAVAQFETLPAAALIGAAQVTEMRPVAVMLSGGRLAPLESLAEEGGGEASYPNSAGPSVCDEIVVDEGAVGEPVVTIFRRPPVLLEVSLADDPVLGSRPGEQDPTGHPLGGIVVSRSGMVEPAQSTAVNEGVAGNPTEPVAPVSGSVLPVGQEVAVTPGPLGRVATAAANTMPAVPAAKDRFPDPGKPAMTEGADSIVAGSSDSDKQPSGAIERDSEVTTGDARDGHKGGSGHPPEDSTDFAEPDPADRPEKSYVIPENFRIDPTRSGQRGAVEVFQGQSPEVQIQASVINTARIGVNPQTHETIYGRRATANIQIYGTDGALLASKEVAVDYPFDASSPAIGRRASHSETTSEALAREVVAGELQALSGVLHSQAPIADEVLSGEEVSVAELRNILRIIDQYADTRKPRTQAQLALFKTMLGMSGGRQAIQVPAPAMEELRGLVPTREAQRLVMLSRFGQTGTPEDLSTEDAVLVERALALMPPRSREVLYMTTAAGGNLTVKQMKQLPDLDTSITDQRLSQIRAEFQDIAGRLERGEIDLVAYWRKNPTRRNVLTLLACLGEPIGPAERLDELRMRALAAVQYRATPDMRSRVIALYGLEEGDGSAKTAADVARTTGADAAYLLIYEKVLLGILPPNWRDKYHHGPADA